MYRSCKHGCAHGSMSPIVFNTAGGRLQAVVGVNVISTIIVECVSETLQGIVGSEYGKRFLI